MPSENLIGPLKLDAVKHAFAAIDGEIGARDRGMGWKRCRFGCAEALPALPLMRGLRPRHSRRRS